MPRSVRAVTPLENYKLLITFDNGEQRVYDVTPLLDLPIFQRLRDKQQFNKVYIDRVMDTVAWDENADICPDSLYDDSIPAQLPHPHNLVRQLQLANKEFPHISRPFANAGMACIDTLSYYAPGLKFHLYTH